MENRVIKFRAWNHIVNRMQIFDLPEIEKQKGAIQWQNLSIMQFTGLHDKNGKEIYEGDIIQSPYTNSTFKVFYSSDRPEFVAEFGMSFLKSDRWAEAKIIGNIFENPELISK